MAGRLQFMMKDDDSIRLRAFKYKDKKQFLLEECPLNDKDIISFELYFPGGVNASITFDATKTSLTKLQSIFYAMNKCIGYGKILKEREICDALHIKHTV